MTNLPVDPRLLDILVDPVSKVPLRWDATRNELVSDSGRRAYPVREGIPILLASEARDLSEDEVKK